MKVPVAGTPKEARLIASRMVNTDQNAMPHSKVEKPGFWHAAGVFSLRVIVSYAARATTTSFLFGQPTLQFDHLTLQALDLPLQRLKRLTRRHGLLGLVGMTKRKTA